MTFNSCIVFYQVLNLPPELEFAPNLSFPERITIQSSALKLLPLVTPTATRLSSIYTVPNIVRWRQI